MNDNHAILIILTHPPSLDQRMIYVNMEDSWVLFWFVQWSHSDSAKYIISWMPASARVLFALNKRCTTFPLGKCRLLCTLRFRPYEFFSLWTIRLPVDAACAQNPSPVFCCHILGGCNPILIEKLWYSYLTSTSEGQTKAPRKGLAFRNFCNTAIHTTTSLLVLGWE